MATGGDEKLKTQTKRMMPGYPDTTSAAGGHGHPPQSSPPRSRLFSRSVPSPFYMPGTPAARIAPGVVVAQEVPPPWCAPHLYRHLCAHAHPRGVPWSMSGCPGHGAIHGASQKSARVIPRARGFHWTRPTRRHLVCGMAPKSALGVAPRSFLVRVRVAGGYHVVGASHGVAWIRARG